MDSKTGTRVLVTGGAGYKGLPDPAPQPSVAEVLEVAHQVTGIVRRVIQDRAYRVFLFGSWASGEARGRSDIDIGIEGPTSVDPAAMLEIREACEALPTLFTVEIVDFARVAANFRKEATSRALRLKEPSGYLQG